MLRSKVLNTGLLGGPYSSLTLTSEATPSAVLTSVGITTTPLFDYCISPEPEFHMSSVTFQFPELSFLQIWRSLSWSVVMLPSGAV